MRIGTISGIVLACVAGMVVSGCVSQGQYDDLKAQNRIQLQRIEDLDSRLGAAKLTLGQLQRQLQSAQDQGGVDGKSKSAIIAALEKDIERKKALIAAMQAQLLRGGVALPVELSLLLRDFAENNDIVTFDETAGILKFKSDLLFDSGSDVVKSNSVKAISALCGIMNSSEGGQFDIIIAGHTDDQPIRASKARHPTNWHLSVHRGISVLKSMTKSGISPKRLSVRGFGEFRPATDNKSSKGGNPVNRRVEIYIVPSGA